MSTLDSVPLGSGRKSSAAPKGKPGQMSRLGSAIWLFLSFLLVISDAFTNCVLSKFGDSAVKGRERTTWGSMLGGMFLVIIYSTIIYLAERGLL